MATIFRLSRLYFLGKVRQQVHLATLFLGVILFMLPAYVNAFSLGVHAFERISKDFGLTLIQYFGMGLSILLASSSIPTDIEKRSIYPILARPLNRSQYIVAHYLAVLAVTATSFLFLAGCLCLSISALTRSWELNIFLVVFSSFLQSTVISAVCVAFSTFVGSSLAATLGTVVFLLGSLPGALIRFFLAGKGGSNIMLILATVLKASLPNLSIFALKEPIIAAKALPYTYLLSISAYALGWIIFSMLFATVLFNRRDL